MPPSLLSYSPEQTRFEYGRIVAAALDLFLQRGLVAVSLAEVALRLRMPLGALERHFPAGKPALVQVALQEHLREVHQQLAQQQLASSNAVEELLAMRRFMHQLIGEAGHLFFRELYRYYPRTWRHFAHACTRFTGAYLRANFRRGVQEGFYWPDLAAEALIERWLREAAEQQDAACSASELAEARHAHLSQLLASLATPLGAYVARRLQEAPPYY
jgi:AcrR family transcriptional regulator